ncbi:regulator of chromosome condensation 1/beta-lactamase-inhibitor protein II [Coemansia spiralis]|nr:regulator of chromosome condensation 1/beta-lactamase-inhibitor protein II [Coemansia spiralis]
MYRVILKLLPRTIAGAGNCDRLSHIARSTAPQVAFTSKRHNSNQKSNEADNEAGDDYIRVAPQVSPYVIGGAILSAGGLAYYLYDEYKQSIHRYISLLGFKSSESSQPTKAEMEAMEQSRLQRRNRARMVPTSTMLPVQQVNWEWTHPGLYATGSNEFGLVDPMRPNTEAGYKAAVPGLEGRLLRSVAFSKTHAAAVDSSGSLYQWGTGFTGSKAPHRPVCTLRDASIREITASNAFVVVLDNKSHIRLLCGDANQAGDTGAAAAAAKNMVIRSINFEPRLGWREHVVSISAGEDHFSAITSSGHVYTCSLGPNGNDRHQLGHSTSEETPEIKQFALKRIQTDCKFSSVVCGGRHILLQTTAGEVYGCGANDFGQLAMGPYTKENSTVRELTPLRRLWADGIFEPDKACAEYIAASKATSYVQIKENTDKRLLAFGCGIDGQLGNGSLKHMQGDPVVVTALSNKYEFDSEKKQRRPLGIQSISASGGHVVLVRDNQTNVVLDKSGAFVTKEPLFGHDVLVWGNNSSGQCMPDRKHRLSKPSHPLPLYKTEYGVESQAYSSKNTYDLVSPRLQAAPKQWVPASSFPRTEQQRESSSKKYLVEQVFVAGPTTIASFLKAC